MGPTPRTATGWDPVRTHLPIPGTANLRDLGGTPTGDGRVVGAGRLYRAEALVEPGTNPLCAIRDEAQTEAYRALGVRTVIDLRSTAERDRDTSAWPTATGADYVSVPVEEGGEGDTNYVRDIREGRRSTFTARDMADYYGLTFARRPREFARALRMLTDPDRTPVLVHCAAGKDRTGLLVALALEALGVDRDVVVADYALTGTLRPDRVLAYAGWFEGTGVDLADVATLFDAPAAAMTDALRVLDDRYGSVVGYLESECGITATEIEALRRNLLVSPS